jgi:hypothetical protein
MADKAVPHAVAAVTRPHTYKHKHVDAQVHKRTPTGNCGQLAAIRGSHTQQL